MNKLGKILGIGALAIASLAGCIRSYNIDGKTVRCYTSSSIPMVVKSDSDKTEYQRVFKRNFSPTAGKDISMIYVINNKGIFPISRLLLPYNIKDSAIFNQKIKEFDYYLSKIDSIDVAKRKR
jgi:hypothetical protein